MEHHRATRLETFTFAFLIAYAPIETWYSMPEFWDPFYLVDVIGIVLLILGMVQVATRSAVGVGGDAYCGIRLDRRQLLARTV